MSPLLGFERLSFMAMCRCSAAMPTKQEEIFQSLVEASADFIGTIDREGKFLYLNPAGRRMLEIPLDEDLLGQSIIPYNDRPSDALVAAAASILDQGTVSGVSVFVARSGQRVTVSQSFIVHETSTGTRYSTIARDISERLALEQSLRDRADRDPLTGLFNRSAFRRKAEEWEQTSRTHLAMLDLDGFKAVNDTYGHHTGDTLLIQVSDMLRATFETHAIVSRLGGDEFVIIMDDEHIDTIVKACLTPILQPFGAGVSVGTTPFQSLADLDATLRAADIALYYQKDRRTSTSRSRSANVAVS
jgi:diguanylate cyclase (GGDEF)-like protein/PAS domain S-box-containing protein